MTIVLIMFSNLLSGPPWGGELLRISWWAGYKSLGGLEFTYVYGVVKQINIFVLNV